MLFWSSEEGFWPLKSLQTLGGQKQLYLCYNVRNFEQNLNIIYCRMFDCDADYFKFNDH